MVERVFTGLNRGQVRPATGDQLNRPGKGVGAFALKHLGPVGEAADNRHLFHPHRSPVYALGKRRQTQNDQTAFAAHHAQGLVQGQRAGDGIVDEAYAAGQDRSAAGQLVDFRVGQSADPSHHVVVLGVNDFVRAQGAGQFGLKRVLGHTRHPTARLNRPERSNIHQSNRPGPNDHDPLSFAGRVVQHGSQADREGFEQGSFVVANRIRHRE